MVTAGSGAGLRAACALTGVSAAKASAIALRETAVRTVFLSLTV